MQMVMYIQESCKMVISASRLPVAQHPLLSLKSYTQSLTRPLAHSVLGLQRFRKTYFETIRHTSTLVYWMNNTMDYRKASGFNNEKLRTFTATLQREAGGGGEVGDNNIGERFNKCKRLALQLCGKIDHPLRCPSHFTLLSLPC